jgi:hypothetical protein
MEALDYFNDKQNAQSRKPKTTLVECVAAALALEVRFGSRYDRKSNA